MGRRAAFMLQIILTNFTAMPLSLSKKGLAYVDELSPEEMREYRGTLTEAGKKQPISRPLCGRELNLIRENEKR